MAYATLTHNGNQGIWDFSVEVEELSSDGVYREIRLAVGVNTKDFTAGRNGSYSVTCEEANYSSGGSCSMPGSSQEKLVLINEVFDVYVDPGSTSASINFEATVSFKSPTTGAEPKAVARITTITGLSMVADTAISSAKDIYFGDNCLITFTPASDAFSYKLQFSMGDFKYATGIISPGSTNEYTYNSLVIPESEAVNIPNSTYGTVAVSLTQYSDSSGTTTVGATSVKSFRVTLKDSVVPKMTSYSAVIDNSDNSVLNSWGVPLAGYTKVKITANASGIYGSEIKSFSISGDYKATINTTAENKKLEYIGKAITKSGNKSFIITCTDSRGRVSEQVVTDIISFLPYTPPKVTKVSVRKEDYGDVNSSNDRMIATATWEYDSVNGKNSTSAKIYYKVSTAEDWTEYKSGSSSLENGVAFTLSDLKLSEYSSYNFRVIVTDALGISAQKDAFSSTTQVLMDFQSGGKGLGIGKICEIDNTDSESGSLEVSMDAYFFRKMYIEDKTQTLEDYIRKISKYLVEGVDYGDDDPWNVVEDPKPGQVYYKRIVED